MQQYTSTTVNTLECIKSVELPFKLTAAYHLLHEYPWKLMKLHWPTNQSRELKSAACIIIFSSIYGLEHIQTQPPSFAQDSVFYTYLYFSLPWVARPGEGGSLSFQDYE